MTDKEQLLALINRAGESCIDAGRELALVIPSALNPRVVSTVTIGTGRYRGEPVFHFDGDGALIPFQELRNKEASDPEDHTLEDDE